MGDPSARAQYLSHSAQRVSTRRSRSMLEVMVEMTSLSPERDLRIYRDGRSWFAEQPGKRISMSSVLADFGLTPEDARSGRMRVTSIVRERRLHSLAITGLIQSEQEYDAHSWCPSLLQNVPLEPPSEHDCGEGSRSVL